jgi:hypothetical protein
LPSSKDQNEHSKNVVLALLIPLSLTIEPKLAKPCENERLEGEAMMHGRAMQILLYKAP